jgi:hypothetical protein
MHQVGIAVDSDGNVLLGDTNNNCVRKVTRRGAVSTLAGSQHGGFVDGPNSFARFRNPGNARSAIR